MENPTRKKFSFSDTTATKKVFALRKRIRAIAGGTSASKTISVLIWLIDYSQSHRGKTCSVVSESYPHLERGAMLDFENIMKDRGYWSDDRWNQTKHTYTFETGSRIEFFSPDTYGKAHGPRRDVLFINEANNLDYKIADQLIIRTREIVWMDWNPTNEFWFYTEIERRRDDVDFITLTLLESLSFRHINVVRDEYAVSSDGMKMFGVLDLETFGDGFRFSLGLRNANDKSLRLGLVVGVRVLVCDNMAFSGDFEPVLAKHSKHFDLNTALAVGLEQMQRNFKPMADQISNWRASQITDGYAKEVIYRAFIEDGLEAPKHLARVIHHEYFEPAFPDFAPRTKWSLQNAFTSGFKLLEPVPQFKATASFGEFFNSLN